MWWQFTVKMESMTLRERVVAVYSQNGVNDAERTCGGSLQSNGFVLVLCITLCSISSPQHAYLLNLIKFDKVHI